MGYIKRNLIVAALTLFLIASAIPSIAHAQDTVPIAGAKVSCEGSGSGFGTTDSNGKYVIAEGLATGIYSIVVTAPGYIDAKLENCRVTAGQETPNINFFLKRSGAISGVLNVTPWSYFAYTGCPCCGTVLPLVPGIGVTPVLVTATPTAGTGGNPSSYAFTSLDGSYTIYTGLSTGTYKVTAELDGYTPSTVYNVMAREAQETSKVNMSIEPGGVISGMVTTSAGMPLFRALVTAHSSKYSGFAYTDSTGRYWIIKGLGESVYNVYAQYKTYSSSRSNVQVFAEAETQAIIFRLEIPPSGSIIGTVRDGRGYAIKDATVRAGQFEARTDEGGCYSILLGAGDYTVSASAAGFYPSSSTRATVAVNQQTSVDFDLRRVSGSDSGRISGQVKGESNPIPEFQVSVIPTIFALTLLVVLLGSRKIRSVERRTRFS